MYSAYKLNMLKPIHYKAAATAAAKSLQSCPTLCDPTDSTVPGILQARTLEWVAISFSIYAEYTVRNARLGKTQTGINIAGRNINNLRYADDTTLMAESKEELKSLLMKERGE